MNAPLSPFMACCLTHLLADTCRKTTSGYSWFGNPLVVYATDWIVLVFCVLTACTCEHPSVSALRCAYGDGGPFFRGCSTGHLPRTALGRSCLDVPALSSVKRPIFLSSAPSRWAGCLLLCATIKCEPLGLEGWPSLVWKVTPPWRTTTSCLLGETS